MEFVLLPLLLLAGLFTWGGDSQDDGDGGGGGSDNSGNDSLTGTDDDVVRAGSGNDLLDLEDSAEGFGGSGNDIITASDDARGYGMDGHDSATGDGNATVMGGDGSDTVSASGGAVGVGGSGDDRLTGKDNAEIWGSSGNDSLIAEDSATAYGGWGKDEMVLSDSAEGFGGVGDDVIHAQGAAHADGGAGMDVLLAGDPEGAAGSVTLTGGEGQDRFVVTDIAQDPEDSGVWTSTAVRITDFDPASDALGFVIDPELIKHLSLQSSYDAATDTTRLRLVNEDPYNATVAQFTLAGEHVLDLSDVRFYSDTDLTRISFVRPGTQGDDTFDSSGHPSGTTSIWGLSGDDDINLTFGTVYGGAGEDTLSGSGELNGEWGADSLTGSGTLYGGLDNDVLTLTPEYIGGERDAFTGDAIGGFGDDSITAWGNVGGSLSARGAVIDGGQGKDLIRASHSMSIDGGWGDDTLVLGLGDAADQGFEDPNRFEYFAETDGQTTLRAEFDTTELGGGDDRLFITGLDDGGGHVVLDFDPRNDSIGLILPEADRGDFTLALVTNAQSGFLELQIRGTEVKSILLNGVTSGLAPGAIKLFASESAAMAGTSYATL